MLNFENRMADCDPLKQELDALRPLGAEVLQQLQRYYRVSLTYTSNALEGNTLTESETKVVLEDGLTIGGKPMKDHLEALGHAKALDWLYTLLDIPHVTEDQICGLHRLVTDGVEEALPGVYRDKPVIITGTEFTPPKPAEIAALMQGLVSDSLPLWQSHLHPVETAARLHLALVTIHPFLDGNGRTARLVMNLLLMQAGFAPTIIPPVVRSDYIATLKEAQVTGNAQPFVHFISERAYESLKDMMRLLRALA